MKIILADLLKVIGTVFSAASIIAGLILFKKASENFDYAIGGFLIMQGIVIGVVLFFFAKVLINSDKQTKLLEDIRNQIYQKEDETKI